MRALLISSHQLRLPEGLARLLGQFSQAMRLDAQRYLEILSAQRAVARTISPGVI